MIERGPDYIQQKLSPEAEAAMHRSFSRFEDAFAKISDLCIVIAGDTAFAYIGDYTVGIDVDWIEVERDNAYASKAKLLLEEAKRAIAEDEG